MQVATSSSRSGGSAAAPAALSASFASRVACLVYAVVSYALFFATFLYAIGFVTELVVPKTVSGGPRGPVAEALLVNGGLLALFAVQHTIMARKAFKERWTRIVHPAAERATFVLVASLILCLAFWQWRYLPGTIWRVSGPAAWFLTGVSLLGFGIVLVGSFLIDHFELFGLRQAARHFLGRPPESPRFQERSLYRAVRHPLMLGFLLAFWATPVMTMGHLFFAVMCTAYILVGIQIEERTLVAEHGEAYLDYRRRVPMLFPLRRRSS